ncbi:MAG: Asp-tRNA(Asn)/Glu-tRNA(Gln) amidotransferase subunit GatC [Candidatus Omnitrophota bacterium]
MSISKEDVKYVAKLSRIKLKDQAIDGFTSQLDKILKYIEKLNHLDTENTPATSHALDLKNVVRKDENKTSLSNKEVLQNAPAQENGQFKVPKII